MHIELSFTQVVDLLRPAYSYDAAVALAQHLHELEQEFEDVGGLEFDLEFIKQEYFEFSSLVEAARELEGVECSNDDQALEVIGRHGQIIAQGKDFVLVWYLP